MKQKKILVIQGGISSEREISLKSGKACIKALKKLGYLNKIKRYYVLEPSDGIKSIKKKLDLKSLNI